MYVVVTFRKVRRKANYAQIATEYTRSQLYGLHRAAQMKFKLPTHRNRNPTARSKNAAADSNNAQQYSSATFTSLPCQNRKVKFGARLKNNTISIFIFTFLNTRKSEIA